MDPMEILKLVSRWLHIIAATMAVGVPLFKRLALEPALATLDPSQRESLKEAISKRWRMWVYICIMIFLATGLYNFLREGAPWRSFDAASKTTYHLLISIKILLAFGMFFISSALAGRSAVFAPIRQNSKLWLGLLILLGLAIVVISGYLRFMQPAVVLAA